VAEARSQTRVDGGAPNRKPFNPRKEASGDLRRLIGGKLERQELGVGKAG